MNYLNLIKSKVEIFSLIIITLFIGVFSLASFAFAGEDDDLDPEIVAAIVEASDIYICHATNDEAEPFQKVTVGYMLTEWLEVNELIVNDESSEWLEMIDIPHFVHDNDIVPTATVSDDVLAILEVAMPGISILATTGRNLDTEYSEYGTNGKGIYEADCVASTTQEENIPEAPEVSVDTELDQCEIEGHKYDQAGSPLANWQMGLMKVITQGENNDVWDLVSDTTDSDGYFCLEWDGETRQFRGEGTPTIVDGEYSFVYRVYEKLVDDWKNISVEMGSDYNNLSVVPDEDIQNDGKEVSVKVSEVNGYIFANAAYHVDFYNKKNASTSTEQCVDTETVKCEVVENTPRRSGSSGTRVDRRATPEPQVLGIATSSQAVLGEQVSLVPTGAPNTGAGGTSTNNTLTISQILFVSRRSTLDLQ